MTSPFSTLFLRDVQHGGTPDQLATVAEALAGFIAAATVSVDVAIYDFRLADPHAVTAVVGALTDAADRGVTVRIGYDAGKPAAGTAADFAILQADPAPAGTADWISQHFTGTKVQTKPITAGGQLMHSKYVLRDAPANSAPPAAAGLVQTPAAVLPAVWTGSTNFTDDAWTRQENNIITITDPTIARSYRIDFDQMWTTGKIAGAGRGDAGTATIGNAHVGWDFCPGDGAAINTALAARVTAATKRLVIAAMVLTSHEVLAALTAATTRGVPLTGIFDGGQMDPIVTQWQANPNDATVLADWNTVSALLSDKQSTPYSPTGPHDFMHCKILLADDTITTGSYNFSANAERNAENQLHLTDPTTVTAYTAYLAAIAAAYA